MRHGFGLLAMIGFCCFLGLCLLTSSFYYHQLTGKTYETISKKTPKSSTYRMRNDYSDVGNLYVSYQEYHDLELQLKKAAITYVKNNSILKNNKIIISLQTLQNQKIIDVLYDSSGHSCNGYVVYDALQDHYTPYLRCGNYRSSDYVNRFE